MLLPFHAVIQGPLNSPPTPSRTWPASVIADCVPSTLATATAVAEGGGTAVVSTWANEDGQKKDNLAKHPAIAALIETPDPGKPADTNGPASDNRLRQALSTWRGLEELERRGVTGLVAKIRTDQTLPLSIVHRFASDFISSLDDKARDTAVLINGAHLRSLYEIDDLVFIGTLPAVKRLFEAQVKLAPFHSGTPSIHGDIVRKHLYWTARHITGWPAWRCFPTLPWTLPESVRPRVHADMITPWVRTLLDFLIPMPTEVWPKMTWRSSPPFAEWFDVSDNRIWFEQREVIKQRGEDFFLEKYPNVFNTRGSGWLQWPLDYALEVPGEIERGRATRRSIFFRRARRAANRRRFGATQRKSKT